MSRMSKAAMIAIAAILVASPAFAWTCKATNASGATYLGVGVFKAGAADKALTKCRLDSAAPRSCVIVNCWLP